MTFGERLTQLRKEHGYNTRNEFAEKLGIPSTTLRNYETDVREPGHTFLKQVSELFNVSVDYLLCLTDDKEVLNTFRIRLSEETMLKKYRSLTADGRLHVDNVLTWETEHADQMNRIRIYAEKLASLKNSSANIIELQPQRTSHEVNYFHSVSAGSGIFILGNEAVDKLKIPDSPQFANADYAIDVSGDSMEPDYHDGDVVLVSRDAEMRHGDVGIFVVNGNAYIKEYGEKELISRNPACDNIPVLDSDNIVCMGKVIGKL